MTVSVLIPAFRATYLSQSIASVLAQGITDFELIVSDDSKGDDVKAVVDRFSDRRIRYTRTAGGTGAVANCVNLWTEAERPFLKYVFDDDVITPNALAALLRVMQVRPGTSYVFGQRYIMNAEGWMIRNPTVIAPGKAVEMNSSKLVPWMVGRVHNAIGEFSNILINRNTGVEPSDFLAYEGFEVEMLGDVAFYLNAARKAPGVGLGLLVGGFRRHPNQQSERAANSRFVRTVSEWELFVRGEYAAGALDRAQALTAVDALGVHFQRNGPGLSEIDRLMSGHARLREQIESGDRDVLRSSFPDWWAAAHR